MGTRSGPRWAGKARRIARENGERYFIGSPCYSGHSRGLRFTSNGACVECISEISSKSWKKCSKSERREYHREYMRERRCHDVQFKLEHVLRAALNSALAKEYRFGSAVTDLGCSIEYFIEYIATLFLYGMTWDNYGEWELDHIKPLSKFDLTDNQQRREAFHYSNLQPLWALDNNRKKAKKWTKQDEKRQRELRIITQFWKEQEERHPIRQAFARMKKALDP